ncbi:DUF1566 domain-containing protein [Vibrio pacinii]|uniref:Lcl C-terminal domain-containing protein n=1 Tax=Vibrio pacinii TaxID=170674 RepID=UPI00068E3E4A|nr:DUF1566 domain-containing protein [Vibrio pacinii]
MKFVNQQQIKKVAPLMVALLMSACGHEDNSGPPIGGGSVCSGYAVCDSDGDGINDEQEIDNGTDPSDSNDPVQDGDLDSDGDGIKDGQETVEGWDKNDANNPVQEGHLDSDSDGIKDGLEEINDWGKNDPSNPAQDGNKDNDGDGLKKGQETIEGWDDNDTNNPVNDGAADNDGDGYLAGQENVEGWDDFDEDNPISAQNVENVDLVLDNEAVTPGMSLQASVTFELSTTDETQTTLDMPDANHISWSVVDSSDNKVEALNPTSEGKVTIPDVEEALTLAQQDFFVQATFLDDGWFEGQTVQDKAFMVTLAEVSSTEVVLLKDGVPLVDNQILVGESVKAQSTVQLEDGNDITVPDDETLGVWSISKSATELGVTINPVTGELDTSAIDSEKLDESGTLITISWKGSGSLQGGHDRLDVLITASTPVVTTICGDQINDKDPNNAAGNCLKVADDSKGNWFTSTPSIEFLEPLGYSADQTKTNTGRTYASEIDSNNGKFAEFVMNGNGGHAITDDRQSDRYCAHLASLNFAGRDNWRMPTIDELNGLFDKHGKLSERLGWPTTEWYWSSTTYINQMNYKTISLSNGTLGNHINSDQNSVSCVSITD